MKSYWADYATIYHDYLCLLLTPVQFFAFIPSLHKGLLVECVHYTSFICWPLKNWPLKDKMVHGKPTIQIHLEFSVCANDLNPIIQLIWKTRYSPTK